MQRDSSEDVQFGVGGAVAGVRESLPVAASVFVYGVVFGLLARQASLNVTEALLMSVLVFAGSAQFVVLDLWGTTLPVVAIVVTTVLVNLRHLLMGASLYPWLRQLSGGKVYGMLFFLNDESWGMTMRAKSNGRKDAAYLFGSGLMIFLAWVGATPLGVTAGALITNPARYGLDFAFVAVYIALLVGVWEGRQEALPIAVAAVVAVGTSIFVGGYWYIVLGGLLGGLVGVWRDNRA